MSIGTRRGQEFDEPADSFEVEGTSPARAQETSDRSEAADLEFKASIASIFHFQPQSPPPRRCWASNALSLAGRWQLHSFRHESEPYFGARHTWSVTMAGVLKEGRVPPL